MTTEILRKTVTLLALVDPVCMMPLFLKSAAALTHEGKLAYARALGITVFVAVVITALAGRHLLEMFGISLASMQISGGGIALMLAVAMVVGHAKDVRVPTRIAPQCSLYSGPRRAIARLSND